MTDFFADLERQLVDATPRRAQRLRRARRRRLAMLSTILLALVAGGAGLATAIGGSDAGTSAGGGPAAPAPAVTTTSTTPAIPKDVERRAATVDVLNGTTVPGLARGVANRLQDASFTIGNVTNAPTQDRSTTLIEFAPGNRSKADAVARAIGVSRQAIRPASNPSKMTAGDQATVIVLVGSDQNTAPTP